LTDKEKISNLLEEFRSFKKETAKIISDLRKEVQVLKERLNKYENPKNSINSSIPPSQDPGRQTKSLRKKSGKKAGGQLGRKGCKLMKSEHPDKIIFHNIATCECCETKLPQEGEIKSRQIFDIPSIKIEVTEHRTTTKICGNCGKKNKSSFPKELVQEAQYGNNIKAFTVYLQNYQMLPFARCSELIYDLTGHKISVGSLANFQTKCFENLKDFETQTKKTLLQSAILHADETGVRVNGKLGWFHVLTRIIQGYSIPKPNYLL